MRMRVLENKNIQKLTIGGIAWVLLLCTPLYIHEPFVLHIMNLIFMGSCLALAWSIPARAGYISFGHNAFLGIGAYTSAYVVMQLHTPYWTGFLAAGIMAAVFSLVLGFIILRFRGIIFVLATFCFAQIMIRVFRIAEPITGGADGIRSIPPPVLPFIGTIESHGQYYVLFFIYLTMIVILTVRLYGSGFGRELKAIGENMFLAESTGIHTFRNKLIAFIVSALIFGFSGSFHAHYMVFISDTTFEMNKAIEMVVYNVVGGQGTVVGPIIGAAIMIPLPELLRGFVAYQIALYGLILILVLRFFPMGVWGAVKRVIWRPDTKVAPGRLEQVRLYSNPQRWLAYSAKIMNGQRGICLECNSLHKNFGGLQALDDVSLSVPNGAIMGVIGPNGSGKSTLYNIITGVYRPDKGTVTFQGKNITGVRPSLINQLGIARVFQSDILYSGVTVRENVARALIPKAGLNPIKDVFGLETRKSAWVAQETSEILELCGLNSVSEELPTNLPHGFQRMMSLAMAVVGKPKLLLLDEPVSGMNIEEMGVMASTLEQLRQKGLTMVLVEHNVNFVMRLCHHIVVLNYGRQIAKGTSDEVKNNPEVIKSFMGG